MQEVKTIAVDHRKKV